MFIGFIGRFVMANIWWVLFASSFASAFAGGYAVRTWYQASLAKELRLVAEKSAQERKKAHEVSKSLESALASEKAKRIAIEGKLRYELQNPAYSCVVPLSGVQLLRDAVGSPAR